MTNEQIDRAYKVYTDLQKLAIEHGLDEKTNPLWAVWRKLDEALLKMGALEPDDDVEEENDDVEFPEGWDEDLRYDEWRDKEIVFGRR